MVEHFSPLQQPLGSKSCLPTAIMAILQHYKYPVSFQNVSQWCQEGPDGCVIDIAIDGIRREEIDVEELTGNVEHEVRSFVNSSDEPIPVLVTIKSPFSHDMDHAVVVLDFDADDNGNEIVTYMDPLSGNNETMPTAAFLRCWDTAGQLAFVIRA